jgi:Polysaccharide lyase
MSTVLWRADHETGNLSQWTISGTHGGTYNSGDATTVASSNVAHSGIYSCKMTIDTSSVESGCRQFRHEESLTGNPYYYSVWYYIPVYYSAVNYWNVFQFKSETSTKNDPFWVLDLMPRETTGAMHLLLRWKGVVGGPFVTDTSTGTKYFDQTIKDVPIARWFLVEAFLEQASDFTGRLTVWQDNVQLWDMVNVKTKYPGGDQRWSVNNYSDKINPNPTTIYIDDATVSNARIGLEDVTPPAPPTGLKVTSLV